MHGIGRAIPLILGLALAAPVRGQDPHPSREVLALQDQVARAVERAEPSIACVLVSRSDAYRHYGLAPSGDVPGQLGRFSPSPVLRERGWEERLRRNLEALDLSNPKNVPEAYGSGVVLDPEGLVLTNAHVVRNATKVYVRLPGGRGSWADIHALDPRSDLAVLRLLDRLPGLKALKLGDGNNLKKGQFVLSLANPFAAGFRDGSPSVSWGLISNLRRRAPGLASEVDRAKLTLHHFGTLVQTDARLNLGCSGGALLNLDGELIGLTTALAALSGSETPGGYAIPLDDALRQVIQVLLRGEEVEYGFLGVALGDQENPPRGVQISQVTPGSPAARAGLQPREYVLRINSQDVRDNEDLFLLVGRQLAGSSVRLEVGPTPQGPARSCTVKLAKYYVPGPFIASHQPPARGGIRVDYTSIASQRVNFPFWAGQGTPPEGVVIREVLANSAADKVQLQVDKIITRVNNRPVTTPAEYYQAVESAGARAELTVLTSEGKEEHVALDLK